jgi:hypothetical protein
MAAFIFSKVHDTPEFAFKPEPVPPHGLMKEVNEGNLMNEGFELVCIRSDDYVAKLLEREAGLLPPGFEASAHILLQQAKSFRESARTATIKISKHVATKLGFISR